MSLPDQSKVSSPIGSTVSTYSEHFAGAINAIAWSPDGKRIAAAGDDGTVQVWDATTGGHQIIYQKHSHKPVRALAWSPEGGRIASGGDDGTVQVWLADSGNSLYSYSPHGFNNDVEEMGGPVLALAWSSEYSFHNSVIAFANDKKYIGFFRASNGSDWN